MLLKRLEECYPDATCALRHGTPFELLVATILSAQCTDERVNRITPELFSRLPDAHAMSVVGQEQLEVLIKSTGFFRNKARSLIGASRAIVSDFGGQVPETMEELLKLPGVARKTANVVLGTAFAKATGIVVDTHVGRLAGRLGLSMHGDPGKIEKDLMTRVPRGEWIDFAHRLIHHGRQVCRSQRPRCQECTLADLCPYFLEGSAQRGKRSVRKRAGKAAAQ